jgi:hypothetical protein
LLLEDVQTVSNPSVTRWVPVMETAGAVTALIQFPRCLVVVLELYWILALLQKLVWMYVVRHIAWSPAFTFRLSLRRESFWSVSLDSVLSQLQCTETKRVQVGLAASLVFWIAPSYSFKNNLCYAPDNSFSWHLQEQLMLCTLQQFQLATVSQHSTQLYLLSDMMVVCDGFLRIKIVT